MSNDRHLKIDDGTMGNLFRRVTLATLGLDSMDGVSEQSFEVIERADSFAERLLGGVSHVMPKFDVERMGTQATSLSDEIYSGMSGLNGPRNATDLGDWQYWLDATLLMLFDEDEEEEAVYSSAGKTAVNATRRHSVTQATSAEVRQRVAALQASGIRPAMLQSLPHAQKRALIQELSAKTSKQLSHSADVNAETISAQHKVSAMDSLAVAKVLQHALQSANEQQASHVGRITLADSVTAIEKIFNRDSHSAFVSHMADKAAHISSSLSVLDTAKRSEVSELARRWTNSIAEIGSASTADMSSVREMMTSLAGLEKAGAVTAEQAAELRRAGQTYARRAFAEELSRDVSAMASRINKMANATVMSAVRRSQEMLPSHKAVSFSIENHQVLASETVKRSLAALNSRLNEFNAAVSSRVMTDGDSAATVRWMRAADRFTRMQGISDDVDRVLLRDVVESASALSAAGIVPQHLVDAVTSSSQFVSAVHANNASHSGYHSKWSESAAASKSAQVEDVLAHFGTARVLGQLAGQVEQSVEKLMRDITKAGISNAGFDSFISDIRQIVSTGTGRNTSVGDLRSSVQASSVIESICAKLDAFADMAASSVVTRGYDDLCEEGTYVSTAEKPEANVSHYSSSGSVQRQLQQSMATVQSQAKNIESNLTNIRQLQQSLVAMRNEAQNNAKRMVEQQLGASNSMAQEERTILESMRSAATVEAFMNAQQALYPLLGSEARTEFAKTVDAVRRSHSHLESVSRQIQLIEDTLKLSSNLRQASRASLPSTMTSVVPSVSSVSNRVANSLSLPIHMGDVKINSSYLSSLGSTLSSYAKIRNGYTSHNVHITDMLTDASSARIERMLSIVKPVSSGGTVDMLSTPSSVSEFARQMSSGVSFGYDEIVPSHLSMVSTVYRPNANIVSDSYGNADLSSAGHMNAGLSTAMSSHASANAHEIYSNSDRVAEFAHQMGNGVSFGYDEMTSSHLAKVSAANRLSAEGSVAVHGNVEHATMASGGVQANAKTSETAGLLSNLPLSVKASDSFENARSLMAQQRHGQYYPSNSVAGNIASVLGYRKAAQIFASDVASGNAFSVQELSDSLQKLVSSDSKYDSIVSYGINDAGERIQLSIGLKDGNQSSQSYELRRAIGESYKPASVRGMAQPVVNASVSMKTLNESSSVSGVEQFVSVIAGANDSRTQKASMVSSLDEISAQGSQGGRDAIVSLLGRFGMLATPIEGLADSTAEKLRLTVGGVDFDMPSHAFIQMVAKPVMSSVSHSMPSMMDANNTLYSGYASLLSQRGERRNLKALRQIYVEELSKAGKRSAHAQVGFSTQSFTDIFGITPTFVNNTSKIDRRAYRAAFATASSIEKDSEHVNVSDVSSAEFSNEIAKHGMSVEGRNFGHDVNYSWISNVVRANGSVGAYQMKPSSGHSDNNTQQLLGRIDNMFDYVETLSERNVGVFSTDDTVRVLLEALPADSSLGNKGLPKWRQKETKASRIAEARELREALARIGASPVQGTQRFANKQYVSPNLMPNQASGGTPLFSGGSDSGSTPSASANASGYSSDVLNNASIPDEDLQFIAEEVFHRIEESLCEEYQRRRTE